MSAIGKNVKICSGGEGIIELLLDRGADVNLRDKVRDEYVYILT